MRMEISQEGARSLVELPAGASSVGGAPSDRISLEGLAPRWLTLSVDGELLVVEGRRPFLVDRAWCPAGRKRLLLPGETIHLTESTWLRYLGGAPEGDPGRGGVGTVAVARELFGNLEAPSSRAGWLRCLTGLELGRTYYLADGQLELGRGEGMGIRIRDRHVSRRHALLSVREGGLFIEDLGTTNGVVLNGQRVAGARMLVDGDLIELGTTLLRYGGPVREHSPSEVPASLPPAAPAPSPASAGPEVRPAAVEPGRWRRPETALALVGATLALVGLLATWAVSREPAPGQRDPPAAPSTGGAGRRSS